MDPEGQLIPMTKRRRCPRIVLWIPSLFAVYMAVFFTHVPLPDLWLDVSAPEAARFYTYSVAHADNVHLGTNMLTLWMYGGICEMEQGPVRTAIIQTLAVIWGALGALWECAAKHSVYRVVGASGGVYGLLASLIGHLFINWAECSVNKRIMYITMATSALVSDAVVSAVMNVNVSYGAHAGGFVGGLLASIAFSRNERALKWERPARIVAALLVILLLPLLIPLANVALQADNLQ